MINFATCMNFQLLLTAFFIFNTIILSYYYIKTKKNNFKQNIKNINDFS